MYRLLFFFLLVCFFKTSYSQTKTNIHIVTAPRNHLPGFPNFHFTVNGSPYKLTAGQCLELTATADSIHVIVEDKRWVKKETENLHLSASEDIYIWVRVTWTGNYKNPRYGAEVVCKSCFEELKNNCKKTLTFSPLLFFPKIASRRC